jgi:hypothetical protein
MRELGTLRHLREIYPDGGLGELIIKIVLYIEYRIT